jgi:hypothetical protein
MWADSLYFLYVVLVLGVWKISDESFTKRKVTMKVKNLHGVLKRERESVCVCACVLKCSHGLCERVQ